jgi:hypothetical protein
MESRRGRKPLLELVHATGAYLPDTQAVGVIRNDDR